MHHKKKGQLKVEKKLNNKLGQVIKYNKNDGIKIKPERK